MTGATEHTTESGRLAAFFLRLEQHDLLGPAERAALQAGFGPDITIAAGRDIVSEGDRPAHSTLMISGFSCRYRTLRNGRRQILALHLAGDFIDLHSFALKEMDHSVSALTKCSVAQIPHAVLQRITEDFPHLTRLLWLLTLVDAAILREWAVGLGQRSAVERLAHLFCELYLRFEAVRQAGDNRMHLPIRQADLGDALGITPVHTNRTLQTLRRLGLIEIEGTQLHLPDRVALARLAGFDDLYLHRVRRPR